MTRDDDLPRLDDLIGDRIVLDFQSTYVCLGTLVGWDGAFFELADADLHDLRDSRVSREIYVYESAQVGIRRNRARVLLRRAEVVAITRLDDISES